ncbi:MAG TPA: hypothetical protein PKJ23_13685 [bacterium]|nr:hypothetical protein [bacterium]
MVGEGVEFGVLADASDEDGSFGQVLQDGSVGEAAVDTDDEGTVFAGGILIGFVSEVVNALGGLLGGIGALLFESICLLDFFGGVGSGALGCGG